jgi:hypothetical protein
VRSSLLPCAVALHPESTAQAHVRGLGTGSNGRPERGTNDRGRNINKLLRYEYRKKNGLPE